MSAFDDSWNWKVDDEDGDSCSDDDSNEHSDNLENGYQSRVMKPNYQRMATEFNQTNNPNQLIKSNNNQSHHFTQQEKNVTYRQPSSNESHGTFNNYQTQNQQFAGYNGVYTQEYQPEHAINNNAYHTNGQDQHFNQTYQDYIHVQTNQQNFLNVQNHLLKNNKNVNNINVKPAFNVNGFEQKYVEQPQHFDQNVNQLQHEYPTIYNQNYSQNLTPGNRANYLSYGLDPAESSAQFENNVHSHNTEQNHFQPQSYEEHVPNHENHVQHLQNTTGDQHCEQNAISMTSSYRGVLDGVDNVEVVPPYCNTPGPFDNRQGDGSSIHLAQNEEVLVTENSSHYNAPSAPDLAQITNDSAQNKEVLPHADVTLVSEAPSEHWPQMHHNETNTIHNNSVGENSNSESFTQHSLDNTYGREIPQQLPNESSHRYNQFNNQHDTSGSYSQSLLNANANEFRPHVRGSDVFQQEAWLDGSSKSNDQLSGKDHSEPVSQSSLKYEQPDDVEENLENLQTLETNNENISVVCPNSANPDTAIDASSIQLNLSTTSEVDKGKNNELSPRQDSQQVSRQHQISSIDFSQKTSPCGGSGESQSENKDKSPKRNANLAGGESDQEKSKPKDSTLRKTNEDRNQFLETGELEDTLIQEKDRDDDDNDDYVAPSFARMIPGSETSDTTNTVSSANYTTGGHQDKSFKSDNNKTRKHHGKFRKHLSPVSDSEEDPVEEEDDDKLEDSKLIKMIASMVLKEKSKKQKSNKESMKNTALRIAKIIKSQKQAKDSESGEEEEDEDREPLNTSRRSNHSSKSSDKGKKAPVTDDSPKLSNFELFLKERQHKTSSLASSSPVPLEEKPITRRPHLHKPFAERPQNIQNRSFHEGPSMQRSFSDRNSLPRASPFQDNIMTNQRKRPESGGHGQFSTHLPFLNHILASYPKMSDDHYRKMKELSLRFPKDYKMWYNESFIPMLKKFNQNVQGSGKHLMKNKNRKYGKHCFGKVRLNSLLLIDESKIIEHDIPRHKHYLDLGDEMKYLNEIEQITPFTFDNEDKKCFYGFVQSMIQQATNLSEKLLYQLIELIFNSKGEVELSDIGELLLGSYSKENGSDYLKYPTPSWEPTNKEDVLFKLRSHLLNAQKQKAFTYAMNNNEWALATILASRVNGEAMEQVRSNFLKTMSVNDPLRTCFNLMFNQNNLQLSSLNHIKDWGIHLAGILNNSTPENLDKVAVRKLGQYLGDNGDVYGEQFCYLSVDCLFNSNNKFKLLGPDFRINNTEKCVTAKNLLLTMAYENACKLRPSHSYQFVSLQYMKYYFAIKLLRWGKPKLAYCFLNHAGVEILNHIDYFSQLEHLSLLNCIFDLTTRLGYAYTVPWIHQISSLIAQIESNHGIFRGQPPPVSEPAASSRNFETSSVPPDQMQMHTFYSTPSEPQSLPSIQHHSSNQYSNEYASLGHQYGESNPQPYEPKEIPSLPQSEFFTPMVSDRLPSSSRYQDEQDVDSSPSTSTNNAITLRSNFSFAKGGQDGNSSIIAQSGKPSSNNSWFGNSSGLDQPIGGQPSHKPPMIPNRPPSANFVPNAQSSAFIQHSYNPDPTQNNFSGYYQGPQSFSRSSSPASSVSNEVRFYTSRQSSWTKNYRYQHH